MADDWIKMRSNLATHPKVLRMAAILAESTEVGRRLTTGYNGALCEIVTRDVTRDVTLASLLRVWGAANDHTDDGTWRGMHPDDLDQIAGVPGFGGAMVLVGWAEYDEENDTTTFPNFLEYNAPAKNGARSDAAERQRKYRERRRNGVAQRNVTRCATGDVTRNVTRNAREEERREEKNNTSASADVPASGDAGSDKPAREPYTSQFGKFWEAFPRKADKRKAFEAYQRAVKRIEGRFGNRLDAHEHIQAAAAEFAKSDLGQSKFCKYAEGWLNADKFDDDRETWVREDNRGSPARASAGVDVDALDLGGGR